MFSRAILFLLLLPYGWLAVQPCPGDEPVTSAPSAAEPTGQVLQGLVLNAFGGGVSQARVRVESLDAGVDDPPLAETTADNLGRISLRLPRPVDTPVRVRVRADGFADWVQTIDPTDPDDPPFIDATLQGASRLLGVARSARSGEPVPDARVECESAGRHLEARTDERGNYAFNNVFRGQAIITVFADPFAIARRMVHVDVDEMTVDIDLFPERPIELTVVSSNNRPAADVTVEAVVMPTNYFLHAITDAQGRATLHGVDTAAEYLVARLNGAGYVQMYDYETRIDLPPWRPSATAPAIEPAPVRQRAVVEVAASVAGKAMDAETGLPVVGVRVVAGRNPDAPSGVAWTSFDGTYELKGLPPGNVPLYFQHTEHALGIGEMNLLPGQQAVADVSLARGEPVGGTVVDPDDEPLNEVWVTAESWRGHTALGLGTLTAEDGRFLLEHAPPGEIQLRFFKPGFGPPRVETLKVGRADHRIALEPEGPTATKPAAAQARIAVGMPAPEFKLTATDGTVYKLSDLRGRYVFLDFWVSTSPQCAAQLEHTATLHEVIARRADFSLIGVSLDEKREAFDAFVAGNDLTWPQVFGPKSGAKETFERLDGRRIPCNCLIGPDGRVLATHLSGDELVSEVKRQLGE